MVLNLRTTQPFEEVLEDLGQVLKMSGVKRMYTVSGQEVRSFSQLRNEFADVDTFYLGSGHYRYESGRLRKKAFKLSALFPCHSHYSHPARYLEVSISCR